MDEAKGAQYGLLAGVGFVVLIVLGAVIGGSPPKLTDKDAEIVDFFFDNQNQLRIAAYLNGLAGVFFLWFLGSLFGRLRRAEGGSGRLAGVALTAGVTAIAVSFVANGLNAFGALKHPEGSPVYYRQSAVFFSYVAFAVAVFTVGVAVVLWRHNVLPKWFAYAGEAIALGWLVAAGGVATLDDTIFTVGFIVFLAWAVWVLLLSVLLYRTPETT